VRVGGSVLSGGDLVVPDWIEHRPSRAGLGVSAAAYKPASVSAVDVLLREDDILALRPVSVSESRIHPGMLLRARRVEDQGVDLWTTTNRVQENLIRGGVADGRRNSRGVLRTVRALRGIDSKVTINKGLWGIAERLLAGETQPVREQESLPV